MYQAHFFFCWWVFISSFFIFKNKAYMDLLANMFPFFLSKYLGLEWLVYKQMCVLLCKKLLHSFSEFSLKYSSLWVCFLVAPHPFQYLNDLFFWIHFCSCWVFSDAWRLFSTCGEWGILSSCDAQALRCGGFSCCEARAVVHTGFSSCGAWLSCSRACGIFLDQGSNLCLLHWQAHALSLSTREAHGHSF